MVAALLSLVIVLVCILALGLLVFALTVAVEFVEHRFRRRRFLKILRRAEGRVNRRKAGPFVPMLLLLLLLPSARADERRLLPKPTFTEQELRARDLRFASAVLYDWCMAEYKSMPPLERPFAVYRNPWSWPSRLFLHGLRNPCAIERDRELKVIGLR